jgi:hypothetical protein
MIPSHMARKKKMVEQAGPALGQADGAAISEAG